MADRKRGRSGSAGRFGARYGRVARRRVSEIEGSMRDSHACPECNSNSVSREGTGVWSCRRCGHQFAGGAYVPTTPAGRTVDRSIRAALAETEETEVEIDEL